MSAAAPSAEAPHQAGASVALCASSATFSVAVRTPGGDLHAAETDGRRQAAELTAMLDELLRRGGQRPADIVEIRVDRGPGSYTGLRLALTFARVLAAFTGSRLQAATSLELLALTAWRRHGVATDRPIRPVLDARRGRAHTARLELRAGRVLLASPPVAVPIDACRSLPRSDEVLLLAPTLATSFAALTLTTLPLPAIHASDLFDPALATEATPPEALEPLYLMGTYAESPPSDA